MVLINIICIPVTGLCMNFKNFLPEEINLLFIEPLNKSSSLFLNALLDRHPQLIQAFTSRYPEMPEGTSPEDAAEIAYANLQNRLWQDATPYDVPFTSAEFSKPFLQYVSEFGVSDKTAFIGTHYAIAVLLRKDLSKIKWIIFHPHAAIKDFTRARKAFPKSKIVLTIRDPRAAQLSNRKGAEPFPIYRFIPSIPILLRLYRRAFRPEDILVIRHEDLHCDYPAVKKRLCAFAQIREDRSMDEASYFGKPWDGTNKTGSLSKKRITSSRPDPRFASDDWKEALSPFELAYVQFFLGGVMKEFGYPAYHGKLSGAKRMPLIYHAIFAQFLDLHSMQFLRPARRRLLAAFDFLFRIPAVRTLMKLCMHCGIVVQDLAVHGRMYWLYLTCR